MFSKIALVFFALTTLALAQNWPPAGWPEPEQALTWPEGWPNIDGVNPWLPPWSPPGYWLPPWGLCNSYGSTCYDCNTKLICTKKFAKLKLCNDPLLPYCYLGECYARPYGECEAEARTPEPTSAAALAETTTTETVITEDAFVEESDSSELDLKSKL